MDITISEKIRLIMKRKKITTIDLSATMGFSRQNLTQRLSRNTWTEEELKTIAEKMGCKLEILFIDKETGETY